MQNAEFRIQNSEFRITASEGLGHTWKHHQMKKPQDCAASAVEV
ncbi:MAG: hypothetical protein RMX96_32760 [Nostoc sp. ChiSLP02]|nr:hypothetical protein [Nostoc sp. DedSLP05]MDZ8100757.1 hypothetical protein [Nostoc sp. DedSLP01]MDZ8189597.1 hypothetical protein [Nostoc sp. ChiSLP02]